MRQSDFWHPRACGERTCIARSLVRSPGSSPRVRERTARAWLYREQLRNILDRKQINVVSTMLAQRCTNVMRSKVEPMKQVAAMIRNHFDGIVAWARPRQTSGFIEAQRPLADPE
jgi:hypothetical protein